MTFMFIPWGTDPQRKIYISKNIRITIVYNKIEEDAATNTQTHKYEFYICQLKKPIAMFALSLDHI